MIGVHSGFTEIQIDEFSYSFYKGCIKELIIKIQFDSVSHLLGNNNCDEKTQKAIDCANPLNYIEQPKNVKHRVTMDMMKAIVGGTTKPNK